MNDITVSYQKLGVCSIAILSVLNHFKSLPISKIVLIMPFVTNKALLRYLSHGSSNVQSIEKLIIEKAFWFSNFNLRFYDSLTSTLNTIQFLNDLGFIFLEGQDLHIKEQIEYEKEMGNKAFQIFKASKNIANLLDEPLDVLYLNLRVVI